MLFSRIQYRRSFQYNYRFNALSTQINDAIENVNGLRYLPIIHSSLKRIENILKKPNTVDPKFLIGELEKLHQSGAILPNDFLRESAKILSNKNDAMSTEILLHLSRDNYLKHHAGNENLNVIDPPINTKSASNDNAYFSLVAFSIASFFQSGYHESALILWTRMAKYNDYQANRIHIELLLERASLSQTAPPLEFIDRIHNIMTTSLWDQNPKYYSQILGVLVIYFQKSSVTLPHLKRGIERYERIIANLKSTLTEPDINIEIVNISVLLSILSLHQRICAHAPGDVSHGGSFLPDSTSMQMVIAEDLSKGRSDNLRDEGLQKYDHGMRNDLWKDSGQSYNQPMNKYLDSVVRTSANGSLPNTSLTDFLPSESPDDSATSFTEHPSTKGSNESLYRRAEDFQDYFTSRALDAFQNLMTAVESYDLNLRESQLLELVPGLEALVKPLTNDGDLRRPGRRRPFPQPTQEHDSAYVSQSRVYANETSPMALSNTVYNQPLLNNQYHSVCALLTYLADSAIHSTRPLSIPSTIGSNGTGMGMESGRRTADETAGDSRSAAMDLHPNMFTDSKREMRRELFPGLSAYVDIIINKTTHTFSRSTALDHVTRVCCHLLKEVKYKESAIAKGESPSHMLPPLAGDEDRAQLESYFNTTSLINFKRSQLAALLTLHQQYGLPVTPELYSAYIHSYIPSVKSSGFDIPYQTYNDNLPVENAFANYKWRTILDECLRAKAEALREIRRSGTAAVCSEGGGSEDSGSIRTFDDPAGVSGNSSTTDPLPLTSGGYQADDWALDLAVMKFLFSNRHKPLAIQCGLDIYRSRGKRGLRGAGGADGSATLQVESALSVELCATLLSTAAATFPYSSPVLQPPLNTLSPAPPSSLSGPLLWRKREAGEGGSPLRHHTLQSTTRELASVIDLVEKETEFVRPADLHARDNSVSHVEHVRRRWEPADEGLVQNDRYGDQRQPTTITGERKPWRERQDEMTFAYSYIPPLLYLNLLVSKLEAYTKVRDVTKALSVFDEMRRHRTACDVKLNSYPYVLVLRALCGVSLSNEGPRDVRKDVNGYTRGDTSTKSFPSKRVEDLVMKPKLTVRWLLAEMMSDRIDFSHGRRASLREKKVHGNGVHVDAEDGLERNVADTTRANDVEFCLMIRLHRRAAQLAPSDTKYSNIVDDLESLVRDVTMVQAREHTVSSKGREGVATVGDASEGSAVGVGDPVRGTVERKLQFVYPFIPMSESILSELIKFHLYLDEPEEAFKILDSMASLYSIKPTAASYLEFLRNCATVPLYMIRRIGEGDLNVVLDNDADGGPCVPYLKRGARDGSLKHRRQREVGGVQEGGGYINGNEYIARFESLLSRMSNDKVAYTKEVSDLVIQMYLRYQSVSRSKGKYNEICLDRVQEIYNQHGIVPSVPSMINLLDVSLLKKDGHESNRVVVVIRQMYGPLIRQRNSIKRRKDGVSASDSTANHNLAQYPDARTSPSLSTSASLSNQESTPFTNAFSSIRSWIRSSTNSSSRTKEDSNSVIRDSLHRLVASSELDDFPDDLFLLTDYALQERFSYFKVPLY